MAFTSKAETLRVLSGKLLSATIPTLETFTVGQWRENPRAVAARIKAVFQEAIIVRSSVLGEDSRDSSHAGEFASVAGVMPQEEKALEQAIEKVIASYKSDSPENQFFAQSLVKNVTLSGVIFSQDLDTRAPYFVINYDDCTGSTDSVTSGKGKELRTYVRYRNSPFSPLSSNLEKVVGTCQELERVTGTHALDIEFAVDSAGDVHLLQVRPLTQAKVQIRTPRETFDSYLLKIHRKIQKFNAPHPGLHGDKAIYSVMTDWNPAEIIGIRPRALSLSLYKELVTDCIWAYQRHNYGYRDLRSFPLVVSFMGLPYVDVRASLNSFVPATLSEELSSKLINYYTDKLLESPTDHDKVEFNVVFSCYYLDLPQRLTALKAAGFNDLELDRIKFALLDLTNHIVGEHSQKLPSDLSRINELERRLATILSSSLPPIDKIYWLVEDCKRYGTLPFAGLARAGFIAVQFLRSFVEVGILSAADFQGFMASLNTVAKRLSTDTRSLHEGRLKQEEFLGRYGHLRPGTYDLLSPLMTKPLSATLERPKALAQDLTLQMKRHSHSPQSSALK
jgi:hypothetical protein